MQDKEEASPEKVTGSMRYIKVWVSEYLEGTIRFDLTAEERSVFVDLLAMSGRMRVKGLICARPGTPYPHHWLAGTLNIPLELLERSLAKMIETDRATEGPEGIRITNWKKYQSEYERQKFYRDKKKELDPKKARMEQYTQKCPDCGQIKQSCMCEGSPLWRKLNKEKTQEELDAK